MPRVNLNKIQYKSKDFVTWLAGEMYTKKKNQSDIAGWLGVTPASVCIKMKRCNFTYTDMLVIFQELGTDKETQARLLTI